MKAVAALVMERKDIKEVSQQILRWEWGGTLNPGFFIWVTAWMMISVNNVRNTEEIFSCLGQPWLVVKRVATPEHGMLDTLTGMFAPYSATSPHKLRECFPQVIFLRNRLKYAPTRDEVEKICIQNFIKIDGKVHLILWMSSALTRLERIFLWSMTSGIALLFIILHLRRPNISCRK